MADAYETLSCALRPAMSFARSVSPVRTFGDLALPVPSAGAMGRLLTSPLAERAGSPLCDLAFGLVPQDVSATAAAR